MKIIQKRLCIFTHYSKYSYIPQYVRMYVNELSNYFDQVILVTNRRTINSDIHQLSQNITLLLVENEGYDLGMFYKAYQSIDPTDFCQIACINDSNILFNELKPIFNWGEKHFHDFWGLVDSHEKPWFSTHQNNYHIQSHFVVFNQNAIDKLPAFFEELNMLDIFDEKDSLLLRKTVINNWEIGLTQFMMKQGLNYGSYIDSRSYSSLYLSGKLTNVGHKLYFELIQSGYPLIKKKIITKSNWKDSFHPGRHWKKMIRQYGNQDWEIEDLIDELVKINHDSGNQSLNRLKVKFKQAYNLLTSNDVA